MLRDKAIPISQRVKELRVLGKDSGFCQTISCDEFDVIISLLKTNLDSLEEHEVMDLLATISNVVLMNRQLHNSHFNPIHANEMLEILIGLLGRMLKKQQLLQPSERYDNRIAIYRLVFLIFFDGKEKNHIKTANVYKINLMLRAWYDFKSENFDMFKKSKTFLMTANEIVKALYSLYHNYKYELEKHPEQMMKPRDCLQIVNHLLTAKRISKAPVGDSEYLLTKSILNFHLLIDTDDRSQKVSVEHMDANFEAFEQLIRNVAFFITLEIKQYRDAEKADGVNQIVGGGSSQNVGLIDLLAAAAILKQNFSFLHDNIIQLDKSIEDHGIANATEAQLSLHGKLLDLRDMYWMTFYPQEHSPNDNYMFNQLFQLVVLSNIHGNALPDSEVHHASNLKILILAGYFQLCRPVNSLDPQLRKTEEELEQQQMEKYLSIIGYSNACNYLSSIFTVPSEELTTRYMTPTCPYIVDDTWNVKKSSASSPSSIGDDTIDLAESLFNRKSCNSTSSSTSTPRVLKPEEDIGMTEEEKEREAEKLFTLLSRVEKNPVFKGFLNPIREWQQSGKFENIG